MLLPRLGLNVFKSSLTPRPAAPLSRTLVSPLVAIGRRLQMVPQTAGAGVIRYHDPRAPIRNLNMLLSRNLHTHPPRRTPFRPGPRPTIAPFRTSPWVMFFAGVGLLSALFVVLPLVFTLFFPLVVAGVIAYQFKRWRSAKLYDALYRSCLLYTSRCV